MTRWALATLVAVLLAGAATVAVARFFGKSGSRASVLVSVVAHWLGAYAVWNFAGGLALYYGALSAYNGTLFAVLALVVGYWHYRTRLSAGPEPALAVFVGAQLVWLVVVLAQNGLFGP
ncbi:MAG: hypothetical protein HY728_10330 [Candidatus Rokubacteria bacterium]|nr:hypothetical protein [Candidatus Rokubacteria bacterium]